MKHCESCNKEYSEIFDNCPFCNFIDFEALKAPFPASDIQWRVQSSGEKTGKIWARVLAYVTSRAIQERLDDVVGVDNWMNEFKQGPSGGVLCGLSVFTKHGWITKWDGAENTQVESVKGGLSDAIKRAAVLFGIGRYLYKLDVDFAIVNDYGIYSAKTKEGKWFKWDAPKLPAWALPDDTKTPEPVINKTKEQAEQPLIEAPKKEIAEKIVDPIRTQMGLSEEKFNAVCTALDKLPKKIKDYFFVNNMDIASQYEFCKKRNGNEKLILDDIQALEISKQFNQIDDKMSIKKEENDASKNL